MAREWSRNQAQVPTLGGRVSSVLAGLFRQGSSGLKRLGQGSRPAPILRSS